MKTIYLVRHAKANLMDINVPDFDRPLLEKGKKRTKKIIDFLIKKQVNPDLMISSPAIRAIETARFIAKGISYPVDKIKSLSYYYKIDGNGIFKEFMDFSDEYDSVMIVGHNPAITNFVNRFLDKGIDSLPTSGVVCIHFQTDTWEAIESTGSKLGFVIYPSLLKELRTKQKLILK